jgi:hypothetical protein
MPTGLSRFVWLALLMLVADCNTAGTPSPAPQVQASATPPGYATERYTPQGFALPQGEGCQGDVARFRGVMTNDYGTGNVNLSVYRQITAEIDQAAQVCASGDGARASAMIRATKAKFGYPG